MSSSLTNENIPGMIYPTQKAMLSGNPRDSANTAMINANQSQANANKLMAGGKIKKKSYGGNSSQIVVPQYNMLYTPQGGTGTNPNDQIQINAKTSTQIHANSVYDKFASVKGGTKRRKSITKRRRGGNPNWHWGCMSGGRKKKSRKHTKSRKFRK